MQENNTPSFIVGLGASAGGLEALELFFDNMSVTSGMAFVVIQHLAPDFKSLMDELLTRHTTMAIHKAENGMSVEANSIYLIPPKKEMVIADNKLLLRDRSSLETLNLPIDIFFHSLAEQLKDKAIGIILSGTGSDGSRGIAHIHEYGGFVLCQTPSSARFDGMPNSAISTGLTDVIANPDEMSALLVEYINHTQSFFDTRNLTKDTQDHDIYSPIFLKLNESYDVDFQYYKPATVGRRIERRMALQRIHTVNDYTEYLLQSDNDELELLYRDLLIGVTQFFRDEETWQYLEKEIIPEICESCTNENELRFWVPGCASGEEAYSIAILAHEWLTENQKPLNIRIFATDLHKGSLEIAGKGIYQESSLATISKDRIDRYFIKTDNENYEIAAEIRRMVVFATHNLLKDPPFTKLDFISCRNLLIYFLPQAQKRVLNMMHFSLKVGSIMLLGSSESLADIKNEFEELDRHNKIFKKRRDIKLRENIRNIQPNNSINQQNLPLKDSIIQRGSLAGRDINLIRAYDSLLHQYVPPSVLVESTGTLAHTFGDATDYLRPSKGVSSLNILDLLHPDIRMAVSTGLQRANKEPKAFSYGGIEVNLSKEDKRIIRVIVHPLSEHKISDYTLIIFEEIKQLIENNTENETIIEDNNVISNMSTEHVKHLEEELRYTKENLQATVEELETSNEELQATNEELMASNEELQSTNEELHSVNEELYTVNKEYEEKIHELTQLTDDMDNLLASTDIGTIFLDKNLKIRKFTPAAAKQFSLLNQDIGRPINHFNRNIEIDNFHELLETTLTTGNSSSFEVKNIDENWFLMNLNPYRNDKNETTGIVITFVEITLLKAATKKIIQRNEDLQIFSNAISTELTTPVKVLINFSHQLQDGIAGLKDSHIQTSIEKIHDTSKTIDTLLKGILEFSQVITLGETFCETSLIECLEGAKIQLKKEIDKNNISILCQGLPMADCDKKQMQRVFFELLSNSLKFKANDKALEIDISAMVKNSECVIYYKDNGIGISEDEIENIFTIFHKVQIDKKTSYGVGTGLAIAKRIIERHNGTVRANSLDSGTEFIISLPLDQNAN